MLQLLICSILQLDNVFEWDAHRFCSLHGIPEVINHLRQINVSYIVWIIVFIAHDEAKLRFLAELLFWQVLFWIF